MQDSRHFLAQVGLPVGDAFDLPTSPKRFPDGAQYRVEIPSVEGPRALALLFARVTFDAWCSWLCWDLGAFGT